MFEVGQSAVCINNLSNYTSGKELGFIKVGGIYVVKHIQYDYEMIPKFKVFYLLELEGFNFGAFNMDRFVSLLEFRRIKLEKIVNNIYTK